MIIRIIIGVCIGILVGIHSPRMSTADWLIGNGSLGSSTWEEGLGYGTRALGLGFRVEDSGFRVTMTRIEWLV